MGDHKIIYAVISLQSLLIVNTLGWISSCPNLGMN